ncbi:Uncharacterised protein [Mycobacterium tuberculosis]|uniref:Uncharacterized protein n=1 Tax=Mycobacterium tuberculosis TaxID=1773 RepID=A0A655FYN2_MYCTX|nr:Uncharacterised protein [Mycobacterium tuberculosis]CNU68872.1 Uncharacterised protein [Mycobacterium tuberculosis]CNV28674.1 Uncharacterised protein [Mycobacterium tuberculosis]CNX28315.1 Uncharacterised protein [Mycobacterium tuberculosis]CPC00594.1 Uncharacterised protein [Mycobacterium tuberculosis]
MPRLDAVFGQRSCALQDHDGVFVEEAARPGGDHTGFEQGRQ